MKETIFTYNDVFSGPLCLVNRKNPVRRETAKGEGMVPALAGGGVLLARTPATMLQNLVSACGGQREIEPVSGYRTMEEQVQIYEDTLRERGSEFAEKYVAFPGCSEHQTGLAIDLARRGGDVDFIRPTFPYSGVCGRFRKLAARFGFVERYTKSKTHVTGIGHEPWHFRYVGWPHAELMEQNGWVLEEYIEWLSGFTSHSPYTCSRHGREMEMFTVPVPQGGHVALPLPARATWQASGNNTDGVVVTVWKP